MARLERILDRIEAAGNKLPDPVTLFVILIGVVLVVSAVAGGFGLSAKNPATGDVVRATNLFSGDMIRRLFTEMPSTFAAFPPLGTVLVTMLGVGVAERSGLIGASLSGFVRRMPNALLTPAVVFAAVMSSLAADAGYVVLVPLAGVLFAAAGRHPVAGIAAAFAGVSGGFSANLLLTPLDALLAGLTESAARIIDPAASVPLTANYFLMIVLVPIYVALGTWVTTRLVEPRLKPWSGFFSGEAPEEIDQTRNRRGLRAAFWTLLVIVGLILVLVVPATAPLRGDDGGLGPFYASIVGLIFLGFLALGIAYGVGAGTIRSDRDAVNMASGSMSDMGLYLVLAFVAAHFIALFSWSNLGIILAINGADFLSVIGLTGVPLLVMIVLLVGVLNIFVGSASAKWALLAPVLVPMLMLVGVDPAMTQAAYRMGDSVTNVITPLMPYFPMVLVFARRYDRDFGIGSLLSAMLPYTVVFAVGVTVVLVAWVLIGLPLGPGPG